MKIPDQPQWPDMLPCAEARVVAEDTLHAGELLAHVINLHNRAVRLDDLNTGVRRVTWSWQPRMLLNSVWWAPDAESRMVATLVFSL